MKFVDLNPNKLINFGKNSFETVYEEIDIKAIYCGLKHSALLKCNF